MARPSKCRRICMEPAYESFTPQGISCGEQIVLTVDEYEVIRLVDLEKLTHEQCAKQMDISRTTVTEIYEAAREKIADSIVYGKTLLITGGNYRLCDGSALRYCQKTCKKGRRYNLEADCTKEIPSGQGEFAVRQREGALGRIPSCPEKTGVLRKGADNMRIAVTYENGSIFQHFGHTEQFKLYDVEDGKVVGEKVVDTNGQGHGALSGFLTEAGVDALICGGIGGGAQMALADAGIQLFGGVSGSADDAVKAYLAGNLEFNPDVHCSHHEHGEGHSCGSHHCGEDKHGCAGHQG